MPVASSSRRRASARTQESSDIEEERSMKATQDDVDDDEDEVPQKKTATHGKQGPNGKGKSKAATQSGIVDDDDNDERIDVSNFTDQPFTKAVLPKLKGLSQDWSHMSNTISTNSGIIVNVAVAMADYIQGDEADKGIAELDAMMKDIIDVTVEMQANEQAIDEIYQSVARGDEIDDAETRYTKNAKALIRAYESKTTRQKYAKNEQYISFKQRLYEAAHPDEAMPPLTELIPKEDGDDSDDDDDIEIGGATQDYKCPLTLTPLSDPWTSQICGHSFSGEAIRAFFQEGRSGLKMCPASGCSQSFTLSQCKPDKELAKRVKAAMRRARRRDDDSDEEVIE